MHDVLVVGAGPAGASTAIHLARAGFKVLLVDRATFPRPKVCGEGLFPAGVAALGDLGVLETLLPESCVIESLRFSFDDASAEAPVGSAARPGLGVRRELLDATLVDAATKAGVELRLGVRALGLSQDAGRFAVETDAGRLEAPVIVAADGLRSVLRRSAGLDAPQRMQRYGVNAHFELDDEPAPRVDIFIRRGYEVYVTPVGGRLINVAVLLGRAGAGALGGDLPAHYLGLVTPVLPVSARLIDTPRAAGPFPAAARRAWRDNLVLAGDAAGFFDGISGEGLSLALVSSQTCAAAAIEFLNTGSTLAFQRYERKRRRLALPSTLLARLSLALASRPALGRRAVLNLRRHPDTFARLIALNGGDIGFRDLRARDVLALAVGL